MVKYLPDDGLRLMIYDTSDSSRSLKDLRKSLPQDHFVNKTFHGIDDVLPGDLEEIDITAPVGLSHMWTAGGRLYRWLRWLDVCKGFSTWTSALEWLATYAPTRRISSIQYWGHGSPGRAWMLKDREYLRASSPMTGPYADYLQAIKARLTPQSLIWFRCCSVFCGLRGQDFALTWANQMECRIAAHTYTIGAWQSGLHTIAPGGIPSWDPMEGVKRGTPDRVLETKWSKRTEPNTVFMLTGRTPQ